MYKAFHYKKAIKYYETFNNKTAKRINKAVEAISANPLEGPHIKRLKGTHEGKYRYAVGDLRIVYRV